MNSTSVAVDQNIDNILADYYRDDQTYRALSVELLAKRPDYVKQLQSLTTHVDVVSSSMSEALEKHYTTKLADWEREIRDSEIAAEEKLKLAKRVAEQLKVQQAEKIEQLKKRLEQYQEKSAEQLLVLAAFNSAEELRVRDLLRKNQQDVKNLLEKLHTVVPNSGAINFKEA